MFKYSYKIDDKFLKVMCGAVANDVVLYLNQILSGSSSETLQKLSFRLQVLMNVVKHDKSETV